MSSSEATLERAPRRSSRGKNDFVQPFLKWAGGKRQLLPRIREFVPRHFNIYFEPFVGAGAVLFDLQHSTAAINDANCELINCYKVIKSKPEELINDIGRHKNESNYFYSLRELDRMPLFNALSDVERASRIIFLNKTCYNGLFRVNRQGQFNAPFGDYKKTTIVDPAVIRAVSRYLNEANVAITSEDFAVALEGAGKDDFVYLDPPYDPVSDTASFTGYNLNKFDKEEQITLKDVCDDLTHRRCKILLSNSDTSFIRDLYSDSRIYTIIEVEANRNINSVGTSRGKVNELLIYNNYDVK